eukprot:3477568-Rhodomonas_salina.1
MLGALGLIKGLGTAELGRTGVGVGVGAGRMATPNGMHTLGRTKCWRVDMNASARGVFEGRYGSDAV